MDTENIINNCVELGERCDHERMHNLLRNMRRQQLESAKIVRQNFNEYFNQEGSLHGMKKIYLFNSKLSTNINGVL